MICASLCSFKSYSLCTPKRVKLSPLEPSAQRVINPSSPKGLVNKDIMIRIYAHTENEEQRPATGANFLTGTIPQKRMDPYGKEPVCIFLDRKPAMPEGGPCSQPKDRWIPFPTTLPAAKARAAWSPISPAAACRQGCALAAGRRAIRIISLFPPMNRTWGIWICTVFLSILEEVVTPRGPANLYGADAKVQADCEEQESRIFSLSEVRHSGNT